MLHLGLFTQPTGLSKVNIYRYRCLRIFNKLIDFADLGNPELNYSTFTDSNQLTTHALVRYVPGLCSSLNFFGLFCHILFHFLSGNANILERHVNLRTDLQVACYSNCFRWVIPKRKFYQMHHLLCGNANKDVVYRL